MRARTCRFCQAWYLPDPRTHRPQKACPRPGCQAQRHRLAQRRWRLKNPTYDDGRHADLQRWRQAHPGYWHAYRHTHPAYVRRNRRLQRARDAKRRHLAKRDAMDALHTEKLTRIRLLGVLAKRDPIGSPPTRQTEELCRYLDWVWRLAKRDDTDKPLLAIS